MGWSIGIYRFKVRENYGLVIYIGYSILIMFFGLYWMIYDEKNINIIFFGIVKDLFM